MSKIGGLFITTDTKLIEAIDGLTTYIQRKGWMPLNTIKMIADCLFWGLLTYQNIDTVFVYIIGPLGGLGMWYSHTRWIEAVGYWENVRKAQSLNAEAYHHRSSSVGWRAGVVISMTLAIIVDAVLLDPAGISTSTAVILVNYLLCCLYLGPGDFAKDRKESLSSLHQET